MINQKQQHYNGQDMPEGLPATSSSVSSAHLIQIIWHHRVIVLMTTAVVMVIALVYLIQSTPYYKSTSRIYVEQEGPKIITQEQGVLTQSKNYLYTQSELIKSAPILDAVAADPVVAELKTFAKVDNPTGYLKGHIQVDIGKRDDIINITCESPYPEEAAFLVNSIVDSYITYHSTFKRTTSNEILKILRQGQVERDQELKEKRKLLLDFTRIHGAVSLDNEQDAIIMKRLGRLSEALTEVQLEMVQAKAEYDSANAMLGNPAQIKQLVQSQSPEGDSFLSDSQQQQLHEELEQLESQLEILMREVTTNHPNRQDIEIRIARQKRTIAEQEYKFAQAYCSVLVQRWMTAMEKEAQIRSVLEEQEKLAFEFNTYATEFAVLQSDLERTEKRSEIIHNRIKEISVTGDADVLNITILEFARAAGVPSSPQKNRTMALSLVLGLILGFTLALLNDWRSHCFHSAEEISAVTGVPVLGTIPAMNGQESVTSSGRMVSLYPTSPVSEAFRSLRTALHFGLPKQDSKILLITSATAGVGKTTLVSNLGVAMAQSGQRTLIIDGDFYKPLQHKIFKIKSPYGLTGVLLGKAGLDRAISRTAVNGLHVLPSGPITDNASELFNRPSFISIIKKLANKFDRVLIDSPPLLNVDDARILGALCDTTLLVLRAEKSNRKDTEIARDSLLSVGANLQGIVLNAARVSKKRYNYYRTYTNRSTPADPVQFNQLKDFIIKRDTVTADADRDNISSTTAPPD
ncbi:MAG: polysaccharide biosynthesis tyrosine autokinase [Planctomycetes bacterium]|nr:polysaccharide biosynthesis tyrosine autokinase [Planctomycetota bacterium]